MNRIFKRTIAAVSVLFMATGCEETIKQKECEFGEFHDAIKKASKSYNSKNYRNIEVRYSGKIGGSKFDFTISNIKDKRKIDELSFDDAFTYRTIAVYEMDGLVIGEAEKEGVNYYMDPGFLIKDGEEIYEFNEHAQLIRFTNNKRTDFKVEYTFTK